MCGTSARSVPVETPWTRRPTINRCARRRRASATPPLTRRSQQSRSIYLSDGSRDVCPSFGCKNWCSRATGSQASQINTKQGASHRFRQCAVVRLGCYFPNIQSTCQFVDLWAFGGYDIGGIIPTLRHWNLLYWTVFIYCFLANAFFLLRSLRSIVLPDPSVSHSAPLTHAQRSLRF